MSQFVDQCEASIGAGASAQVLLLRAGDDPYDGREVSVDGEKRLNFGSCSYLGLEVRDELRDAAIDAVRRYGTQFPFAKPQLECALYGDLHAALEAMTDVTPIVASSATLAHLGAMPALFRKGDAVLVDKLAHASMLTAMATVRDVRPEMVAHNRMSVLAERIDALSKDHDRIWYVFDGVYSMTGDFAPIGEIERLLGAFPKLHLYGDDAHCTSWYGKHGRGLTLHLPDLERVVVTLSLNKAFSAGGAALFARSPAIRDRIRHAGAAMMFSGPLQPAQLGAAVGSARLHVTEEFAALQRELQGRVAIVHALAASHSIKLGTVDHTPIAFIPCGRPEDMFALFHALLRRGFFLAPAVFPAVPADGAGLRLTVSLHNDVPSTERLFDVLAEELKKLPEALAFQARYEPLSGMSQPVAPPASA